MEHWDEADDLGLLEETMRRGERFARAPATQKLPQQFGKRLTVSLNEVKDYLQARWDQPHPVAVSISPPQPTVAKAGSPRTASAANQTFASVTWGIGGASHRAEVDVRGGTSFVLTTSYLEVAVKGRYAQPVGVPPLTVSVTAAPCAGGAPTAPPTRTVYMGDVQAGVESAVLPIPAFAVRAQVWARMTATSAYLVRLWEDQGTAEAQRYSMGATSARNTPDMTDKFFLSPQIDGISVLNNSAAQIDNFFAIFELGLA